VTASAHINKMNIKNLSVIFTPALFHDHNQAESAGEWYSDKVLEDLVLQYQTLFVRAENRSRLIAEQFRQQRQQQAQLQQQQQPQQSQPQFLPQAPQQQQTQKIIVDSPSSASVSSLPFSVGGIVGRKASLS
jgi:hypothetical protein